MMRAISHAVGLLLAYTDWLFATQSNEHTAHGIIPRGYTGNILIHCHWSPGSVPEKHEIDLLQTARVQNFLNLVVINTDGPVSNPEASWGEFADIILIRPNNGRDLAAYRVALHHLRETNSKPSLLVFTNNSVVWLKEGISSYLQKVINSSSRIGSATVSFQPFSHMQTFSFFAKNEGIAQLSSVIESKIKNVRKKSSAVLFGELLISKTLQQKNYTYKALFDQKSLMNQAASRLNERDISELRKFRTRNTLISIANGKPVNPSHHFWAELIECGFPAIKKDLIRDNPACLVDVYDSNLVQTLTSSNLEVLTLNCSDEKVKGFEQYVRRKFQI